MQEDGFSVAIPKKYKWDDRFRNDDNFTDKLNLANISTLTSSLMKLVVPQNRNSRRVEDGKSTSQSP